MSNAYSNHCRRTPIDQGVKKTVLFKTIYPDYASFEKALTAKSIDLKDTDAKTVFAYLQEMIGNAYLRFTTETKNNGFLAWNWKKFRAVYDRQKQIFDQSLSDLNTDKVSGAAKLFKVNQTANGDLVAKFLDSGTTQDQTSQGNLLAKYDILEDWANRTDPELRFISNLAIAIVLPLQPENYGRVY